MTEYPWDKSKSPYWLYQDPSYKVVIEKMLNNETMTPHEIGQVKFYLSKFILDTIVPFGGPIPGRYKEKIDETNTVKGLMGLVYWFNEFGIDPI